MYKAKFFDIFKSAALSFILKILGAFLAFYFSILIARIYGPEGIGVYYLTISIMTFTSLLGGWGVDKSLLRHVSAYRAHQQDDKIFQVIIIGLLHVVFLSFMFSCLLWGLAPFLSEYIFHDKSLIIHFRIIVFAIFPFVLVRIVSEIMKAEGKIIYTQAYQSILIPLSLIGMVLLNNGSNIHDLLLSYLICIVVISVIALTHLFVFINPIQYKYDRVIENKIFISATPLLIIALSNNVQNMGGTYLLGVLGTPKDIGIYNIVTRIAFLLNFILIAINSIVAPKISKLYVKNDKLGMEKILKHSVILGGMLGAPLYVVVMLFPEFFLSLFGSEFTEAKETLMVVITAQMIGVLLGPVGFFLIMTGNERLMKNITIFGALMFLVLGVILIPVSGYKGAGIALSISLVVSNVASFFFVRKKLRNWS